MMNIRRPKLVTLIILLVSFVVCISIAFQGILTERRTTADIKGNLEEKAFIVARMVANDPLIEGALINKEKEHFIQEYATEVLNLTGVNFVTIMDMNGIRKSHPDPEKIGKKFVGGDEIEVLTKGHESSSISEGTLGKSWRVFAPIIDKNNVQIGAVSVGITLTEMEEAIRKGRSDIVFVTYLSLLFGVSGAIILARYIKKILFNLEPAEIAKLLQERNALLYSIYEGIIAIDHEQNITVINKSAMKLFKIKDNPIGKKLNEVLPPSKLSRVLLNEKSELNEELHYNGLNLYVNRVPIVVKEKTVGAVATFRDKTEIRQLAEQLTGVKLYAEALRAQSHEFLNQLHVILGMVQLGVYDKLKNYIQHIVAHNEKEMISVAKKIKDDTLAGFIMGKISYAQEKGILLNFHCEETINENESEEFSYSLIKIVGNLINNAFDAVSEKSEKVVDLIFDFTNEKLLIEISDNGSGMSEIDKQKIFEKGFSTKGDDRGLGLYFVKNEIDDLNGVLNVVSEEGNGTSFYIKLPYKCKVKKND